jgi:hypothetical protein
MPSILTAAPNFMGQFFWDGIKKNWLQSNESFLRTSRFPPIILYTHTTNTNIIINDFGDSTALMGITRLNRSIPHTCRIRFVSSERVINQIGMYSNLV